MSDIDQEEVLHSSSGLLNYLFGKDRTEVLTIEKFRKLQTGNNNDNSFL